MTMLNTLIDTHAHLDDSRFQGDLPEVIERAKAAGVASILTIGIDRRTSEEAVRLANEYPMVYAAVAIQPNHVHEVQPDDWERICELATRPKVVAIGETGLDRYWKNSPFPMQIEFFHAHMDFAKQVNLPVIIHTRECDRDIVSCLRTQFDREGPIAGVMHSFTGSVYTAKSCLEMGLHISFAGMITFKNADSIREVAREVPIDRILVETDSPYLAPMPNRGRRNEPANVKFTLEFLAEVRKESVADLAAATTKNARELFRLPNE